MNVPTVSQSKLVGLFYTKITALLPGQKAKNVAAIPWLNRNVTAVTLLASKHWHPLPIEQAKWQAIIGAGNEHFLPSDDHSIRIRSITFPVLDVELCFQLGSAADVHGRRLSPVQFRNPEHPEDHGVHV